MKIEIKDPYIILLELFILFTVLKLCDYIAWSWWWVTLPLWAPLAFYGTLCLMIWLLMALLLGGIKTHDLLRLLRKKRV